jgi:2-dehydropantoate 2-reductase
MKKKTPCAIVGDGRMASHFARYLELSGIPLKQWSRRSNSHEDPVEYFNGSRAVFLLIRDDAIDGFIKEHPGLRKMNPIHFSGSLYMEDIPSIHPLMTFSKELYSLEKYQSIPFINEKGKVSLFDVLPELPNPSRSMDFGKKSLYHSLCVLSGNFTTMLWQKVFSDFQDKLELDSELLIPYMEQTFENLKTNWVDALTGPLARKDKATIERNMNALEGDLYQNVYRSFADTVLKRGNI